SHQETSVGTEVLYGGVENEPLGELERTGTSGVAPRARAGLDATTAGKRLAEQPVRGDGPDDGGDGPGVRSRVRRLRRAAPLVADAPPVPSARGRGAVGAAARGLPTGGSLHRARRPAGAEERRRAGRADRERDHDSGRPPRGTPGRARRLLPHRARI